ncbi:MAG: hypothetical protein OXT69_05725 [Candidatus Poribacteria bacterium]|nr:hypothetical protein [Candidatus Poribacteria bacterium]
MLQLSMSTLEGNIDSDGFAVGEFDNPAVEPVEKTSMGTTWSDAYLLVHLEKHDVIQKYADWYANPEPVDLEDPNSCIPILHKGYAAEIKVGKEILHAIGSYSTKILKVVYGTKKDIETEFSIGAGGEGGFGSITWGETDSESYGWSIETDYRSPTGSNAWDPHPEDKTRIDNGFFKVVSIVDSPGSPGKVSPHQCVQCPACGRPVQHANAHAIGMCPVNGTAPGCGKPIYDCPQETETTRLHDEWHKERSCTYLITDTTAFGGFRYPCKTLFRHCSNPHWRNRHEEDRHYDPHTDGSTPENPYGDEEESGGGNDASTGLSSSDGSYTASAGGTHEVNLVADGPYSQVYWYVKAPGDTGYGTQVEIDNGDGAASDASLSYTFPSDASGEYTITAYIYRSDLSVYEESYTVTIAGLTSSDGSYTAKAGATHQANLVADGPIYNVSWYVRTPGAATDTHISSYDGDGVVDTASMSYTFPAGQTGEYTIKARIYRWKDMSVYEESYTVTVESVIGNTGQ